jgi:peptidyl-prolyl cis-trans isomerase B (cyclophilin B)
VKNFIELAKAGFYDGTRFHRVIRGFVIQGGDANTKDEDPGNDGLANPGFTIKAEFNDTPHDKGVLSMARHGADPNSSATQFFLVHDRASHLDRKYTAFGQLAKGLDVLEKIANVPVDMANPGEKPTSDNPPSRPTRDVWLKKALVLGVMK